MCNPSPVRGEQTLKHSPATANSSSPSTHLLIPFARMKPSCLGRRGQAGCQRGNASLQHTEDSPSLEAEVGTSWNWLSDATWAGCAAALGGGKSVLTEQLTNCFGLGDSLAVGGCSLPTSLAEYRAEPDVLQPSTIASPVLQPVCSI